MTRPARIYLIHQYSRDIAVPSGSILMSTGCYLVQTDDGRNILIDSGMPGGCGWLGSPDRRVGRHPRSAEGAL